MNVRLTRFTFSFFEELLAADTERKYAIELFADATWQVYEMWASPGSTWFGVQVGLLPQLEYGKGLGFGRLKVGCDARWRSLN